MKIDVAIVGGGPAGATSAMFLADQGIRSVIIERETFPRYHIGESLTGAGGKILRDLGLEPKMVVGRYPVKQGVRVFGQSTKGTWVRSGHWARRKLEAFEWNTWQVRRSEFDKMLLNEAVSRRAQLVPGRAIRPLLSHGGAVTGVRVKPAGGGEFDIESQVLLDCSGQATLLANLGGVTGPKYLGAYDKQIAIFSRSPELCATTAAPGRCTETIRSSFTKSSFIGCGSFLSTMTWSALVL